MTTIEGINMNSWFLINKYRNQYRCKCFEARCVHVYIP